MKPDTRDKWKPILVLLQPVSNETVCRRRYNSERYALGELKVAASCGWAGYVVSKGRIVAVEPGRRLA